MARGLPGCRLHLEFKEQTLEFSKNSSAFPPAGLAAGTREACPFMVRKFQILKGELGPSLQFWIKPSPGVWVVTWWDFLAWVAPPLVRKGLRWQRQSSSVGGGRAP